MSSEPFLAGDRVTLVYQDAPVSGIVKSAKEGRLTINLADARCVDVLAIDVRRARPIIGTTVDKAALPEATWQRDLLYADGPLVSLLTAQNGDNYLWIWSDCDALGHRWIVIRVSPETLTALSDRVMSLKAALNAALDPDVWVVDWGGSGEVVALAVCSLADLPESYQSKSDEPLCASDGDD